MKLMLVALAGWINQQQEDVIDYATAASGFATITEMPREIDDAKFWTLPGTSRSPQTANCSIKFTRIPSPPSISTINVRATLSARGSIQDPQALQEHFGAEIIAHLLSGGIRSSWESELRASRERHLSTGALFQHEPSAG